MCTVRNHSRYVLEATRMEGIRDLTPHKPFKGSQYPLRASADPLKDINRPFRTSSDPSGPRFILQDLGWNVFVNTRHVPLRSSPPHSDALAMYISPYPCREFTTNPRSTDRYFVPLSE